ncbi:hypothetical protein SS1G_05656 [Sclerotinia sclerotiorum 1980 UF-70]|uniref:RTA1 domain protein n=1 Tax=Sclerotinia sclerotiorum (strain ATCC 18683 / 1980 / Ss-1) TaxID=665079 RepID=A7EK10_SCLS1|nr:hypothetical protein SS1G_05656 [Sclerotinia sclerotiorum 1980 UF-70]EDO03176.1 hypothetical protein SS1G_05656 [Sclerotinia sclerotiorum 1980 UF-70]
MSLNATNMSPPYPQRNAIVGLTPTRIIDIPVSTIFMLLFLLAAIIHMTLLQINFRRGQKFLMSGMAFGFSFSRVITCILRIVWASYPDNIKLALAAQVFVAAGTTLLFLINIIFTGRLLRAYHAWAWNVWIRNTFRAAAGTAYKPREIDDPAWYHSKACFYIFDFGIEIVVLYVYAAMRVDRRFIVPNATKVEGDFRKGGEGGMPVKGEEGERSVRWEWMRGWKGEWREWKVEGEKDEGIFSDTVREQKGRNDVEEGETETAVGSNASGGVTPEVTGSREDVNVDADIEKGNK